MTSDKKIAANQNNGKKCAGPTTELGKRRSKRNATKHGVLASELVVDEMDKPEFETLRTNLRDQLHPATTLRGVGFGRILSCIWKTKLAQRFEAIQLKATLDQLYEVEHPVQKDGPAQSLLPTKWYYASRADLRTGLRLLSNLHNVVQESGWFHLEELKPEIVRAFGEEFLSLLTHWIPMSPSAIKMANSLAKHAEKFPLPHPQVVESKNTRVVADPQQSLQMALKLIDLMNEYLESLLRIADLDADSTGQQSRVSAMELATRYYTTATRELERAVNWYQYLKEHQL